MSIRDHLGVNIEIRPEDMMETRRSFPGAAVLSGRGRYSARGCPGCLMS
jgi:hypothetical protein